MRVGEMLLLTLIAASVCLSWPEVGWALLLTAKIVVYYCLSPG